ncbi:MAG: site-2 protease family protein [Candidatus Micrarchaeota archaeon]
MIILILLIAIALGLFYFILQLDISGLIKFILVVGEMIIVSQILIKKYKLPSEMGLVLLKSKKGIEIIDKLAQHEKIFNYLADVGCSISYGLLSLVLMKKTITWKTLIPGLVILLVLSIFVAPVALSFILSVVKVGATEKTVTGITDDPSLGMLIVGGILLLGGMFLFILFGLVFYGIVVFKAIVTTIFFGTDALATTAAGGTLLLPGINLPFFEGIMALAIVMVVHEVAHAVLARIAKVPILSSGIVLFGIVPIGAFVEPDEKKLAKVESKKQTRVLVAGPTANLLTSVVMFVLFLGFFYGTVSFREEGLMVVAGMEPGTVIYQVNDQIIDVYNYTSMNLTADSEITFITNKGTITKITNSTGQVGIMYYPISKNSIAAVYNNWVMGFIYVVLGLSLALNFVVGTVNILPVPLFDGFRIIDINVKNKTIVKILSYGALLFFALNFLPLLFH